jgi:small subunit ribosomal protein S6
MNIYENIVILDAALTDEETDATITKIKGLIADHGGEVLKIDVWGRKKLAYEIKKQRKGLYVLLLYKATPATNNKIEEFYRVSDAVLKHLIIRLSAKHLHDLEKRVAVTEPVEQKSEV